MTREQTVLERIANVMLRYANATARACEYSNWSNKFTREETNRAYHNPLYKTDFTREEIMSIPLDTLRMLGFGKWSDELDVLIPLYLIRHIAPDEIVMCIDGKEHKAEDMDNDQQGGYLAYGWKYERNQCNETVNTVPRARGTY